MRAALSLWGLGRGLLSRSLIAPRRGLCSSVESIVESAPKAAAAVPPRAKPSLPFRVLRSAHGNLPVYSEIRNGGTRKVTIVRKYSGDVDALSEALRELCNSKVTPYHGRLEVKGRHNTIIGEWLTGLGF